MLFPHRHRAQTNGTFPLARSGHLHYEILLMLEYHIYEMPFPADSIYQPMNPSSASSPKLIFSPPARYVRVVRFCQGALPPPHPPPPPPRLAVLFLLVLLLASSSSFSSAMSASTSTCTSALPTLRQALCQLSSPTLFAKLFANFPAQCAPLDLNLGPSQLSVHRWTSTWDLRSSVCTAGPQPGTCPAQCAPLDLNLGPATRDLPSSVCTAGPQPGTCPAQCATLDQRPDRMPEDMPDRLSDRMPEEMP